MNLRSRLTGIATGDQAMFVRARAFEAAAAFPDIRADGGHRAVAAAASASAAPLCLRAARRHLRAAAGSGTACCAPSLLMWRLRLAYFFGADPAALARRYGYVPRDG